MTRMLNIGCGFSYHPDWINVDIRAVGPEVLTCDVRKGLPFPSSSFDVVYHSHLLEHLRRQEAAHFMRECFRVLKPGGIMRVVVPDLERICRSYLEQLELGLKTGDAANYDWIMLELYDQTV